MAGVLFLAHRMPFPPDRGDKIRSHHVLRALAELGPVHVATFADDERDRAAEGELARLAASHCLVDRRKPLALAGLEALATRQPVSLAAFHDRRIAAYVEEILRANAIEAIYVFSGQMAQYVPAAFAGRVIADLVDVDSAKFEAYGASASGLRAWVDRREGRLLAREEGGIVRRADVTLLVSEAEAALLRSRVGAGCDRVRAMGNGIDTGLFDPAAVRAEPRMLTSGAPRLVFTGQMDYAPNVEAALHAIDAVLPLVRRSCPGATFHVVGRNPTAALRERDGREGVHVWGRVDDIRPWLAAADVALVPLRIARGVQNKVLEAMAMGLPAVVSTGAATGIDAVDGREFLVRDDAPAMARAVVELGRDKETAQALGASARAWAQKRATWRAALADLPALVAGPGEAVHHAA